MERLEKLNNFVGELVILQAVLNQQTYEMESPLLLKTVSQLNKITKEIQNISMSLRMVPLKQTFQKLQRVVRDTALSLGKQVELDTKGEDKEIDKTLLEYLDDPLVHLIRNAVDHGIEQAKEREKNGKSKIGRISITAAQTGNFLVVEIRDDGGGIDETRVLAQAIKMGLVSPDAQLSSQEILQLVFSPGFSTKSEVSEISGRGVGLDVVKKNIERLSGEIYIESETGKGSVFRIIFPLTLAIIDGMVISIDEERFVIPLAQIHETIHPEAKNVNQVVGKGDILNVRGETVPLFHLKDLLQKKGERKPTANALSLIIKKQNQSFAVVVDQILRQQQVVMKPIGAEIRNRHGLIGSAILGDGCPAMILDLNDLVEYFKSTATEPSKSFLQGVAS